MKKHASKLFNNFKKAYAVLLAFAVVFGMFSIISLNNSASAQTDEVIAIKVKDLPNVNPYFVQELYLEPNTDYVFTYLYSGAPASATVAFKGSNQKSFGGQVLVHEDEEYRRVSLTFKTTDSTDSEASMGTGTNSGKIKAYVGIRNYSTNTALLNTYFADFKIYKKSDTNKENLFRDTQFGSIGSTAVNSIWNAFPSAYWNNNYYEKAMVSKDIFKNPIPKIAAVKVKALPAENPYFVQELYLEPNTDYVFTYLYSGAPASATVAFKGSNQKSFAGQVTVHEDEEYRRVSLTFKTTDSTDTEATMGTGANAGKIKAYVGIRNYSTNTALLNTYFADFKLYKKSDANQENVLRDIQFSSIGSTASGSTWNAFPSAYWDNNYYEKATVEKEIFKNPKPKIAAVKVKALPSVNPYFVQELYLEPNTDYVFTYLYSGAPASATVAFKGSNQKSFGGQVTVHEDEEYYRVSLTFRTTDSNDAEATMGTGTNAGKIKAYVGIRNYSTNSAVLNTYFAEFQLYKKSDGNKENVLRDVKFASIGSTASGSTWNAFPSAYWDNNYYEKAIVDKDIFKNQNPKVTAVKPSNITFSPYFVQEVSLKPETEYVFTYLYSEARASVSVAMDENQTAFEHSDVVTEDGDYNRAAMTFKTPAIPAGSEATTIKAYVGIRIYSSNTAALNGYFADFELYEKSDEGKENLFRDTQFSALGASGDGSAWNSYPSTHNVQIFYGKEKVEKKIFEKQLGVIKIAKVSSQAEIGQWVELEKGATYYTSFNFTPLVDAEHLYIGKNADGKIFTRDSIVYDEIKLKATVKFTADCDDITDAYAESVNYTGDGVLVYVGFKAGALDNGYIYDWKLYKEGAEDVNLFEDAEITRLGKAGWYSIKEETPNTRFSLTSIEAIGGMDVFNAPDVSANSGEYALKSNGGESYYIVQPVSLTPGKTYKFSYYYSGTKAAGYAMFTNPIGDSGSIKDNVINTYKDENYNKLTVEFKAPNVGEFGANEDPAVAGNVIVYIGARATKGATQYFYDFRLYESNKTENDNILLDNDFEYLGYKWKQRFYEYLPVAERVRLDSLADGKETFKHTDYVLQVKGVNDWSPFFLQKVSLTPGTTYSFSFYHSDATSIGEMYTGSAAVLVEKGTHLSDDYIESVINDKLWKRTTTTFVCPEIGVADAKEDPDNPGKVLMYVGFRYYGEDQYKAEDKPLTYYDFKLYETDSSEQKNILKDTDFDFIGKYWFQYYFENYPYFFSQVELNKLDGGMDYFEKISGPDIPVPLGDKMMTYGAGDGGGTLYIDLPYTVKKKQTDGKYYILKINIRPTEGRAPTGFLISTYSGGTTAVSPISVDGYTYTFFVQERYNFRLGIKIARYTSGYISGLEMYEADLNQNIVGTKNVATAFGKNGTFADWNIQPGIRWFETEKGCRGLYPGELPADYEGRTCGKLVPMPKDYFVLANPGEWWNPSDVVEPGSDEVGVVTGIIKDKSGKVVVSATVKLVSMNGEKTFEVKTDKNGRFTIKDVPVGGYDIYIVEDDGNQISFADTVWINEKGDTVELSLVYTGNGINVEKEVVSGGIIKGHILDKKGNPIKNLTIMLEDGTSVTTDENGYFEFLSVPVGIHSVYIKTENGKLKVADIQVSEGVAYELTAADGSYLVYDAESGKVSSVKKENSFLIIAIAIFASVILLAAIAILVIILKKRKNKLAEN